MSSTPADSGRSKKPAQSRPSTSGPAKSARERLQREQQRQRKRERRILGLVALAAVLLIVGVGIGVQQWRSGRAPSALPSTAGSLAPTSIADGKPILLGSPGAPVKVQLYEDFHCPHCADFEEEFGPTLTAAQESGRAAVELYPMSFIDQGSATAANAMACAAEAGFGQAYYLGLFANHTLEWSDQQLTALAGQVSSQVPDSFDSCVTTKAHAGWVTSINQAATASQVTSTPTLFIGGSPVDLEKLTPESLSTMIDQAARK